MNPIIRLLLNHLPRPMLIRLSQWARPLLVWWWKGDRFTDPIDGRSYRKFLPYGYQVQRANALSPGTLSLERHRLLWLYLQDKTEFFTAEHKVLHLAPEQCFVKRFRKLKNLDYITADLNSPLADVQADITALPFEGDAFDMVICNHVLEHIEDDARAMAELYRVLKPGGIGIFQVPLDQNRKQTYEDASIRSKEDRAEHFGQYDHVRVYGLDYFERLAVAGFRAEQVDLTTELSEDEVSRYALTPGKEKVEKVTFRMFFG